MSDVSQEDVKKISKLSRLNLDDKELSSLTNDFNEILHFVDQISEVDTKNIAPLEHVHGIDNVFRQDIAHESLSIEQVELNAPQFQDRFFVVPRVIEEK